MSMHRKLMTGCAVAVLGFGLAACGGGGDGVKDARDSLQDRIDALQTAYGEDALTPEAIIQLKGDLSAAIDRIGSADDAESLTGMLAAAIARIGSEGDADSLTGMLAAAVAQIGSADDADSLMGRLAAANARIGSADDADSLTGMLAAANARIGSADDADSLLGMLAAEQANVMRLSGLLGDKTNPDADSVRGMLAAANARIGTADDPASLMGMLADANARIGTADDPASLTGMLADANAQIGTADDPDSLMGMLADKIAEIGTADDPASLMGMLAAANAQIGTADDPDSLMGMLAAEKEKVRMLNLRITALEEGTAPDLLAPIRMAAETASGEAATAATAAGTAADTAEAADDDRATIQTGEANSVEDAKAARTAAKTAMDEAANALAAHNAAVAAGIVPAATVARDNAVKAKGLAEAAKTAADTARDDAVADSMVELKIAGTEKSVGTAMVDLMAGAHTQTINDVTENTGKVADLTDTSEEVMGVANDQDTADVDEERPGVAAGREVNIGLVVDSDDDSARVALIKSYIGERMVGAYADMDGSTRAAMKTGVVTFDGNGDGDDQDFRLKSAGEHFEADTLQESGRIATETTKGVTVYSYTYTNNSDEEVTEYVRGSSSMSTTVDGETTTTYTYQRVEVEEGIPLPHETDYAHIHFGVWASTGENDDANGDQGISELGIAFVQNFEGGPTEEMPNNGSGEYEGNWVANIQEADSDGDGAIMRADGVATVMANFRMGTVDVTLAGLAELEAEITDNTFAGTEDATVVANTHGLRSTGDFEGTVNGGFFGSEAKEAGGVFDYASEDNEDGAFRGAFGGRRTD